MFGCWYDYFKGKNQHFWEKIDIKEPKSYFDEFFKVLLVGRSLKKLEKFVYFGIVCFAKRGQISFIIDVLCILHILLESKVNHAL